MNSNIKTTQTYLFITNIISSTLAPTLRIQRLKMNKLIKYYK